LNLRVAQLVEALRGLLKQAVVAGQAQELFGEAGAREGPQAGARAAAEDDGGDVVGHGGHLCMGRDVSERLLASGRPAFESLKAVFCRVSKACTLIAVRWHRGARQYSQCPCP
jgi:hypothetical protein